MIYLKYLKDIVIIIALILSLISIRSSQTEIQKLRNQLENTKNNLFQTNEIVGMMQKQLAKKFKLCYKFFIWNDYYHFRGGCPCYFEKIKKYQSYKKHF